MAIKNETYRVDGMHCASCKIALEKKLQERDGVVRAEVNYATGEARVTYDEESVTPRDLADVVRSAGDYTLEVEDGEQSDKHIHEQLHSVQRLVLWVGIGLLPFVFMMMWNVGAYFVNGVSLQHMLGSVHLPWLSVETPWLWIVQFIIATPILFIGGKTFFSSAWRALLGRSANMDTLVALGTGTAWLYSTVITMAPFFGFSISSRDVFFEAAVFIVFFILLGRYLEARARQRTRDGVQKLIALQAQDALVMRGGEEVTVPIADVLLNDIVIVKPGQKIPLDGVIVEGNALIDEAMVTGESLPVQKSVGDNVIGSTIITTGSVRVRIIRIGDDTVLAQIIRLVEEAQGSQAPIQKLADTVAGIFVPIVIGIAVVAFLFWFFVAPSLGIISDGNTVEFALYVMVTILVIACPCALGLATPTAIMVGTGRGAQRGILIKDAQAIEEAHKINTVVFDKTGTITKGSPHVEESIFYADKTRALVQALLLERKSEHPLAQALIAYADKNLDQDPNTFDVSVTGFQVIDGSGVRGDVGTVSVALISPRATKEVVGDIPNRILSDIEKLQNEGYTVVIQSADDAIVALYAFSDQIKEESVEAISALHNLGIKTIMLTGDNESAARHVAQKVGIDHVIAQVIPAQKDAVISDIKNTLPMGALVAMVGDGINDAPAIARADIGIAMGTGTDVAIASGDIVIVKGSLMKVVDAISLSRATMRVIKQNLVWAFGYNIIALPIAAGVLYPFSGILLSPVIASIAMALSSVSVVLNSLRLRKIKI